MRGFSIVMILFVVGCGGRFDVVEDEPMPESIAIGGLGGAPMEDAPLGSDDNENFGGMGGTCSETVTAIEVPEDHCIRIEGHFDTGAGLHTDACQSLTCEDLSSTNVELWRGWGDAVRYVHHVPECGSFDYEITSGPCD